MNRLHSSLHCRPSPAPCFACRVSDDVSDECKEEGTEDDTERQAVTSFFTPIPYGSTSCPPTE